MVIKSISRIGHHTQKVLARLGALSLFLYDVVRSFSRHGISVKKLFTHMSSIGVESLTIIMATGTSIGSVLAYQTYHGLQQFQTYEFIGPIVFLGMVRELGPVLSAIMVAGRAGSAMTAEIGTMQITEQVDALRTLGINVKQYLIVPRLIATTLVLPLLSLFCSLCGVIGSYVLSIWYLGVNHQLYLNNIRQNVVVADIFHGLIKAVLFGFLIAVIATFKGYRTHGGAKDVGTATTQSVVNSCLTIIVTDFILTAMLQGIL